MHYARVFFLLIFCSTQCFAQESERYKSLLTPSQKKLYDYSMLQYGMLDSRASRELTPALRSELVFTLERLVEVVCMYSADSELVYTGPPEGKECLEYLERLEKLHEDNPVALCARHGLDSDSCKDAYEGQFVLTYFKDKSDYEIEASEDLRSRMYAPNKTTMEATEPPYKLLRQYEKSPDMAKLAALERSHRLTIADACNPVRHRLQYEEPDGLKVIDFSKRKERDELTELVTSYQEEKAKRGSESPLNLKNDKESNAKNPLSLGDYAGLSVKKKDTQEERLPPAWRLRLLNAPCKNAIGQALSFDLQFPEAVCYLKGFTAPSCIDARRLYRAKVNSRHASTSEKEQKTVPTKKRVFTEF